MSQASKVCSSDEEGNVIFPSLSSSGAHPGGQRGKTVFVRRNPKSHRPLPRFQLTSTWGAGSAVPENYQDSDESQAFSPPHLFFLTLSPPPPQNCYVKYSERAQLELTVYACFVFPSHRLN